MDTDSLTLYVHTWPWSFGVPEETRHCPKDTLDIGFAACPCLSCAADIELWMEGRHEQFVRERPRFRAGGADRVLAMHYLPHGVTAPVGERRHNLPVQPMLLATSSRGHARFAILRGDDQTIQDEKSERGVELEQTILAWVNVYERFREACRESSSRTAMGVLKNATIAGELPWKDVCRILEDLKTEAEKEPRRALIVSIAQEMSKSLSDIVYGARRVLERVRLLQPAAKLSELDHACVHWLIRQPGLTTAEKAAVNKQRLMGVARKETRDTLENRVLKDFLLRCSEEGRSYLRHDCTDKMLSTRATIVRAFRGLCESLVRHPFLENVARIRGGVRPNYVLQNDRRYRKVWSLYLRLLRQEDDEDKLWIWQNRTWNEIASLMLHAALFRISRDEKFAYVVQSLASSSVRIMDEQQLGCFVARGSEPGPWIVHARDRGMAAAAVLEVVPGDLADEHPLTRGLGRLGAWELLAVTPLDERRKATVIALWPVHTAGTKKEFSLEEIGASAERALTRHDMVINDLKEKPFTLRGLVLCSTLDKNIPGEKSYAPGSMVHAVFLQVQPELWSPGIDMLELLLEDLLEKTL